MKNYVHATVVVTAAVAVNLRKLSQMLDKGDLDGMFQTGQPVGIRNEGPHELIARLGLQFVRAPLP